MKWVFMPGMDGTATLFDGVVLALAQPSVCLVYDAQRASCYADFEQELPDDDLILVGESYSGPLAIRLAADPRVRGLVLCASFARLPYPRLLKGLGAALTSMPLPLYPPKLAIRAILTGWDAPADLVDRVSKAICSVRGTVLRTRLRDVLRVDVRPEFTKLELPMLYLQARHDRLVPHGAARELYALQPGMDVQAFDTAHLLLQRCPTEAARALERFRQRL